MPIRGQRYRLNAETIALMHSDDGRKVAKLLAPGSTIKVLHGYVKANGLVLIEWDGKTCEIFAQDLAARGELVLTARLSF